MIRYRKFGSVMTTVDGIKFRSKAEARRYSELKLMEKAGEIHDLELQPAFPLVAHGKKLATYVADFRYWTRDRTAQIVEDVKGMLTPMYRLKKKWAQLQYGITITEVR